MIICDNCLKMGPQLSPYAHNRESCYFLEIRTSRQTKDALDYYKNLQNMQEQMAKESLKNLQEAKRDPVGVRYDILDPQFLEVMAKIGDYGAKYYGDYNWQKSRLTGGNSPINHIYKHLTSYRKGEAYDHNEIGTDKKIHLAAIAFNAMMEFWYESQK